MNNAASILAQSKGKNKKVNGDDVHDAAASLGSLGGLVGGPARAEALTGKERSEIARHAANMRWGVPCNCSYCK